MSGSERNEDQDLMISYSHSDSAEIAEMLYEELRGYGLNVWYDGVDITLGDRISDSVDKALQKSTHAVVVVSPSYFDGMSDLEFGGLIKKQSRSDGKVILPLLHKISFEELEQKSWSLSDFNAAKVDEDNVQDIAAKIFHAVEQKVKNGDVSVQEAPSDYFAEIQASFKDLADIEKGDKVKIERWRSRNHPRKGTITVVELTDLDSGQGYTGSNFMGTTKVMGIPLEGFVSKILNKSTKSTDFNLRIPKEKYEELPEDRDEYKSGLVG